MVVCNVPDNDVLINDYLEKVAVKVLAKLDQWVII